ncbi:Lipase-like [Zea mays]|uniref:Lipase-like n=1 Tax=Zea mays TaxID=4577 RepID=A0A1D6NV44_MAIZE|nr:Lipase-like [Zea mays]
MRSGRLAVAVAVALAWAFAASAAAAAQKYNAIFNFGDSITDTGNLCTNGRPSQITFTQPPYGETYFGTPTCRCSDGRVIPDFLCSRFGLPFLPPSKSTTADFKKGANMAITGATAMDAPFFRSLGLSDKIWNNGPISFQLQWFQQVTSAVCGQASPARRLQELPGQLAVRVRRVRGQRLQRHAVRQLQRGPGQHVHAADRERHRGRRGEAAGHGRHGRGGAGGAPHRLLPHLPHRLRHLQQRRLRRARLPQEVQRPLHQPQRPVAGPDLRPPGQVQVGAHHVRRLLLRRLRHGQEPRQLRVQLGVPGVLRLGGRQVQLPEQRAVRHVGRVRVLQPGVAPQLGRHPPHRGRLQADHRRLAQRALLPPRHPPQLS